MFEKRLYKKSKNKFKPIAVQFCVGMYGTNIVD